VTVAELSRLETHSVVNTLECAGNGRAFQSPRLRECSAKGCGRHGALQRPLCATCSGTRREIDREARDVSRTRRRSGKGSSVHSQHPNRKGHGFDTLVATHMNGGALPRHHGFPGARRPRLDRRSFVQVAYEIKVLEKNLKATL